MALTTNNRQSTHSTTNGTSYTLASYAIPAGSNRVLVVRVGAQRGAETDFTLSATFNSVAMTEALSDTVTSTSRRQKVAVFYLIAPDQTTANIVVTSSVTLQGCWIVAETLLDCHQTTPTGGTDTDQGNPVTSFSVSATAGSLILAAVCTTSGLTPTWSWSTATEDYDINAGANDTAEVAGSCGSLAVVSTGANTFSATRSATASAQAGVAVEFKPATAPVSTRVVKRHLAQGLEMGAKLGF